MNVLVVEDDPISGLVLSTALEEFGHATTVRADGVEAWQALQNAAFDVVISDWMMPCMDGLELCRRIRGRLVGGYTYVILLTVKNTPQERLEALEVGADDFLVKPLDPADLVARMEVARRILGMKRELLGGLRGPTAQNRRLGDVLVAHGVLTPSQQAELAGAVSSEEEFLLAREWADEEQIARARGVLMDVPYVNVADEPLDAFTLALVSHELAQRHLVLPLSLVDGAADDDKRLRLAMADPDDIEAIDLVQREIRRRVEPVLASKSGIRDALRRAYRDVQDVVHNAVMSDALEQADVSLLEPDDELEAVDPASLLRQSDQAPVVRFVNTLFADAVFRRASDIHLEPSGRDFQILYRVDGQLRPVRRIAAAFLAPVISRVKVMAEMDIAERRLPQDGHISLRVSDRAVDLRVSTLPTQYGERLVVRLLDRTQVCLDLDQIGLSEAALPALRALVDRPHGLVLVTGPTGSGKTTTLYAALAAMTAQARAGRGRRNIITCEDPIEYRLAGISQSNVNERVGLTFAHQLRAILRQDPDVVLVGEIRDGETADIAVRAAMTGHLVLSTLHCNEAAGAVSRLRDLGVAPYLISSVINGVTAQRLVPRLCPGCRREYVPPPEEAALFRDPPARLFRPGGCVSCDGLGMKGRVALHEVLTADDDLRDLIMADENTPGLRDAARSRGMVSLLDDGLEKARRGLVSLDDALWRTGHASLISACPAPPAGVVTGVSHDGAIATIPPRGLGSRA